MRRAVGAYERIVKRFTAQTTDYQELLSTFAEGARLWRAGGGEAGQLCGTPRHTETTILKVNPHQALIQTLVSETPKP
jgi:hypothetical protein